MKPEPSPIERGALPLVQCPDEVWERVNIQPRSNRWLWIAAAAAALVAALIFWSRTNWIESGRLQIGTIGTVDVRPGSRVRILKASPTEHRLELAQGAIDAEINAPPRLFFVDTPAVTAVDLGCRYHLETDPTGNGILQVTGGWVAMGEALVPAGASCRIRAKRGPGTPFFEDAPPPLRMALDAFDETGRDLDAILAAARVRDTLTLWHLLSRVQGPDREHVFDRIAALTPIPAGVTREMALALDETTLRKLREELAWTW